jgi:hypothetical protein
MSKNFQLDGNLKLLTTPSIKDGEHEVPNIKSIQDFTPNLFFSNGELTIKKPCYVFNFNFNNLSSSMQIPSLTKDEVVEKTHYLLFKIDENKQFSLYKRKNVSGAPAPQKLLTTSFYQFNKDVNYYAYNINFLQPVLGEFCDKNNSIGENLLKTYNIKSVPINNIEFNFDNAISFNLVAFESDNTVVIADHFNGFDLLSLADFSCDFIPLKLSQYAEDKDANGKKVFLYHALLDSPNTAFKTIFGEQKYYNAINEEGIFNSNNYTTIFKY